MKTIILAAMLIAYTLSQQLTNLKASGLANINIQLPNLAYKLGDTKLQLFNGVLTQKSGSIVQATLDDRILNADFNNDGYMDAAVVLTVVYDGIGYFSKVVFVVLQDYTNGPYITNGVHISLAIYKFDIFSMDSDNKKIIVGYVDRLPGQPKAALPTVPTITKLAVIDKALAIDSSNTLDPSCYPY